MTTENKPAAPAAPARIDTLTEDERDALVDLRRAVKDGASGAWIYGFVRQYPFNPLAAKGATPAPAMGEELPVSDEGAKIIATFEQHIDKDLDTSPGVTSYWIKQSEVVEAVRACMALRKPGAIGDAYQRDHEKAVRDIEVAAEFTPELKERMPITPASAISHLAYLLAHSKPDATAPVSQPAGQEPVAALLAMPGFMRRRIDQAVQEAVFPKGASVHDGKARVHASDLIRMLAIIDANTAPQPLPSPAGSEQEGGAK